MASPAESILQTARDSRRLEAEDALWLATRLGDDAVRRPLLEVASELKRELRGDVVTVSRNVFIPLTNLCRDRCAYCTFAKQPDSPEAKTWALDEVASLSRAAASMGCIEALFCLGDKPEIAYQSHKKWLQARGFETTAEYLIEACRVSFEAGMLPHTNAGILSADEMTALRRFNVSMGLMLESTSPRLRGKGMAHQYAPDKDPAVRIRMHEEAGELAIPFTSGILLGIGENDEERIDTLLTIRSLDDRFGHIQEAIIQPFHPKPGIRMRAAVALTDAEVAGWVALARLILGPDIEVQAPPNLAPEVLGELLHGGVSDWGGVSPVTVDYINPEAPWPALDELRGHTEAGGQRLVERLPIYPRHLNDPRFTDPLVREAALRLATEDGYARPRSSGAPSEAA
ncbi:MAG: 7,8-didemethyl-8-hydroxy-5-deazariboflavin synthase CofG [Myxococcota bacterium]|nr:7,8-didemethyl-8-hydroxy-5-deazariboflavin synthase CofG [Myxococcota bacterium]